MKRYFIAYTFETYQGKTFTETTRLTLEKFVPLDVAAQIAGERGYKKVSINKFLSLDDPEPGTPSDREKPPIQKDWDSLKKKSNKRKQKTVGIVRKAVYTPK